VAIRFRTEQLHFELVEGWPQRPLDWPTEDIAGVCTTLDDAVILYARGEHPVTIYSLHRQLLASWEEGEFSPRSHGAFMSKGWRALPGGRWAGSRCPLFIGRKAAQYGRAGWRPKRDGVSAGVEGSIVRGGPPYNRPTNLSVTRSGDIYVSDGYGNARLHRFDPSGDLVESWGQPGTGPSQFRTPHGLWAHRDGRIFVADRENDRIQIFTGDGQYMTEWTDVRRPQDIFVDDNDIVYVAELSWFPGERSGRLGVTNEYLPARLSIYDIGGNVLMRWSDDDPTKPGFFTSPHSVCVYSKGAI
jgi:NHL repeat